MLYYTFEESTYFLKRSKTSIVFLRCISNIRGNQSKFLIIDFFPPIILQQDNEDKIWSIESLCKNIIKHKVLRDYQIET